VSRAAANPRRSRVPVWMMGITNALFGMYGGILVISVPQLLSARQVPEATIAAMTAAMISPGFWTFLVCPVLDVRFSRRWYAVVTAVVAAVLLALALLNLEHPARVEALLVIGFFFANLYQSALGGWLASITTAEEKNTLSVWVILANISGGGAMAMIAGEVVQRLSPTVAAFLLGAAVLLPIGIFPWMQAPGPDRRLARESFSQFLGEVLKVLKRREVLIAIVLFIAPAATFSLTNLLGGLGNDFHASSRFVGLVGGAGVLFGGVAGCLIFSLIDHLLPLRYLYLAIGMVGAIFTLGLIVLPHTPATFALALIGENVFQAVALTASTAIAFETIGPSNPLASTNYCLMISAFNIANTYMLVVDGWGYSWHGVAGGYTADASLSLAASLLLAALLVYLSRRRKATSRRRAVLSN
jgi:MFS transporter, PAT family, beta-lactamase induction signal transducer AmpG